MRLDHLLSKEPLGVKSEMLSFQDTVITECVVGVYGWNAGKRDDVFVRSLCSELGFEVLLTHCWVLKQHASRMKTRCRLCEGFGVVPGVGCFVCCLRTGQWT